MISLSILILAFVVYEAGDKIAQAIAIKGIKP